MADRPMHLVLRHIRKLCASQQAGTCLNEDSDQHGQPKNPIVLAEISPNRFNVIDGNHRVERARREGMPYIPAYRVHPHQHMAFLTSARAYEKYVEYWNSKVDDLLRDGRAR
jgi:hypothetical protein